MKLPLSDMTAVSTPAPDVFDVQAVASPSMSTRFPEVSNSRIESFETGEFL